MLDGHDYGEIVKGQKPSLWKPGAEKIAAMFQLAFGDPIIEERQHPGEHLTYRITLPLTHAPSGTYRGSGVGLCALPQPARRHAARSDDLAAQS